MPVAEAMLCYPYKLLTDCLVFSLRNGYPIRFVFATSQVKMCTLFIQTGQK